MTHNPLLAAAELVLKEVRASGPLTDACLLLARHVKAGMDKEPITTNWWYETFRSYDIAVRGFVDVHLSGHEYDDDLRVALSFDVDGMNAMQELPHIKTRGQLLLLLAALGVEVGT